MEIFLAVLLLSIVILIWVVTKKKRPEYKAPPTPVPACKPSDKPLTPHSEPVPPLVPASIVIHNVKSYDQEYADHHNMWICAYCESFNAYPPGTSAANYNFDGACMESASEGSKLQGTLLKNIKKKATVHDLKCVVCGNTQ